MKYIISVKSTVSMAHALGNQTSDSEWNTPLQYISIHELIPNKSVKCENVQCTDCPWEFFLENSDSILKIISYRQLL